MHANDNKNNRNTEYTISPRPVIREISGSRGVILSLSHTSCTWTTTRGCALSTNEEQTFHLIETNRSKQGTSTDLGFPRRAA